MALTCPACDEAVRRTDVECPSCGTELNPVAPPPKAPVSDSSKYLMIVGGLLVGVLILVFMASGMGGSTCGECKGKKYVVCLNCKGGEAKCIYCKGNGFDQQTQSTCLKCNGTGKAGVCEKCHGNPKKTCPSCNGTGESLK
jgi:hypothetical protein